MSVERSDRSPSARSGVISPPHVSLRDADGSQSCVLLAGVSSSSQGVVPPLNLGDVHSDGGSSIRLSPADYDSAVASLCGSSMDRSDAADGNGEVLASKARSDDSSVVRATCEREPPLSAPLLTTPSRPTATHCARSSSDSVASVNNASPPPHTPVVVASRDPATTRESIGARHVPPAATTNTATVTVRNVAPSCRHAVLPDRLRAAACLTCAACTYSVCCQCYVRGSQPSCDAHGERYHGAHLLDTLRSGDPPRCHVCRQQHGVLIFDDVAPFPWSCEGFHPTQRMTLKAGGMYAQACVQKYYLIRGIRDERGNVPVTQISVRWIGSTTPTAPQMPEMEGGADGGAMPHITARRVGDDPAARRRLRSATAAGRIVVGDGASASGMARSNYVVEGSSFFVQLNNPSHATKLMWCARSAIPRGESLHEHTSHPSSSSSASSIPHKGGKYVGSRVSEVGAVVPLSLWVAPPTVQGVVEDTERDGGSCGPWVYEVDVPHCFWSQSDGCATLELHHYAHGDDHKAAAQLPPILRVDVLHGVGDTFIAPSKRCTPPPEAAFSIDVLLHGRHVAVYGIGSKHAFLSHIGKSAVFEDVSVHEYDAISILQHASRVGAEVDPAADVQMLGRRIEEKQRMRHSAMLTHITNTRRSHLATTMPDSTNKAKSGQVFVDLTDDDHGEGNECSKTPSDLASQIFKMTQNSETPAPSPRDRATGVVVIGGRPACASSPPPRFTWAGCTAQDGGGIEKISQSSSSSSKRARDPCPSELSPPPSLLRDLHSSYGFHNVAFHHRLTRRRKEIHAPVASSSPAVFPFDVPLKSLRRAQTLLLGVPCRLDVTTATHRGVEPAPRAKVTDLIILHNIDRLVQPPSHNDSTRAAEMLSEFIAILKQSNTPSPFGAAPTTCGGGGVRLLCSFDNPDFLLHAPRDFLDVCAPVLVQLQSPSWLLPRTTELLASNWCAPRRAAVPLVQALSAAIGSSGTGSGSGAGGGGGGGRRRGLPLSDTVRRVVLSLPESFRQLLHLTVRKQQEAGEDVYLPIPALLDFFQSEAGLFITQGRMRPFLQELTSNRLAVYEGSRHALTILQHHLVSQVLEDVLVKTHSGGT